MTPAHSFLGNGRNPAGAVIRLPASPRKAVGPPKRAARERSGLDRSYRINYDWTIYSPRQLSMMEAWWDRCVELFAGLLPEPLRADPARWLGINLGTFNGCFQKAWMRRGYRMYGIERKDVIDELHAYGCAGHRASFFDLSSIDTATYDFAVLDRCICGDDFHAKYELPLRTQPTVTVADAQGGRTVVPPFFAEMFRILKPGGVLLAVLYDHWSARILDELATHGAMTLWPVEARHPLLAVLVETGREPVPLPDLAAHLAMLEEHLAGHDRSWESWQRALDRSPLMYGLRESPGGSLRSLYLPRNHLVDLKIRDDGPPDVVENRFWAEVAWRDEFFEHRLTILPADQDEPPDRRTPVIVLADDPRYNPRRDRGYEVALRRVLPPDLRLLHIAERVRSSRHALGNLPAVARRAAGGIVVVSLGRGDTTISPRNDRPLVSLEEHLANMRTIVTGLRRSRIQVVLLEALPRGGAASDDREAAQNDLLEEYNLADRALMSEWDCPVVSVSLRPDALGGHATWPSKRGDRQVAKALAKVIAERARLPEGAR